MEIRLPVHVVNDPLTDATGVRSGAMLTALACCPCPRARRPWQRTPAGNGCVGRALTPVSRGRAGGGDEGGGRSGGLRHHPSRLLVRCAERCVSPPCAPAVPPRPACRSIRPLCVLTVCLLTRASICLVVAVRRCKGGDGRGERGRCGRLFEVT